VLLFLSSYFVVIGGRGGRARKIISLILLASFFGAAR
jgi:hypothetical protein